MKILFSTDQIHLHGGIEKTMAVKANYFADVLGYDVTILTTEQKGNPPCYRLSGRIKMVDIAVNYQRRKSYFHPANLAKVAKHFAASKKAIRGIEPDIIISCNYAFDFYWLPFVFKNIPKLKEYHSSRYFENIARRKSRFPKNLKYKINDFIESKFTRLVLLNTDEKQYYRSHNVEVIPNPITIPPTKADLTRKRAIAAGRIAPVKGFDTLIRSWKQIGNAAHDWTLDVYGQGEPDYIAKLQALIDELQLRDSVFIRSAVSDLSHEMLHASLYLMTSQTECYPMVLLEAAALGLPVVSYDCPTGPRHIVVDGVSGLLAANQDIGDFCEKVLTLAADRQQLIQLGDGAKQTAARFSTEVVMQQWAALFKKLNSKG